jgi:hypothetical protein
MGLPFAKSDLCNRRAGEASSPTAWSYPLSLERVVKGQDSSVMYVRWGITKGYKPVPRHLQTLGF